MTREEAILTLKYQHEYGQMESYVHEALGMAIEALFAEPCDDSVSRAKAIRIASGYCHWTNIPDELAKLPSVTPKPKMGRWILTDDDFVYCSECEDSYYPRPIDASWYYCPHCGAKMQESEVPAQKYCDRNICIQNEYNGIGCDECEVIRK